jgi:hypothetical protein
MEAQVDPFGVCSGLSGTGTDLSHQFSPSFYFSANARYMYNLAAIVGPFVLP